MPFPGDALFDDFIPARVRKQLQILLSRRNSFHEIESKRFAGSEAGAFKEDQTNRSPAEEDCSGGANPEGLGRVIDQITQ